MTSVKFSYDDTSVFEDLSITLGAGAWLVVGVNGTGKTTLGQLICGLLIPRSGRIVINGQNMSQVRGLRRYRLGLFLPQRTQTYFLFTSVRKEMSFSLRHLGNWSPELDRVATRQLEQYSLGPIMDTNPTDLSVPQLWRLALCQGLLAHPDVLFIDEVPSLSSELSRRVLLDVVDRRREQGALTLISVHRPDGLVRDAVDGTIEL